MSGPVVMLELNELCPPLLDRFIASGCLPGFAAFRDQSSVFVTDAEEPQEYLNPWIQWVTAHTGVGFEEHGIYKLGEGAALRQPTVADVVCQAGGAVWLCGPMNLVPIAPVRGRWLPDPWNPDPARIDPDLRPFADFVRANVQEHTNVTHRLSAREHARFLRFMAGHGLTRATAYETVAQLAGERVGRRQRWQRAALLDRFQWDLFASVYRRERPMFATFFSNTTAHFQHLYWRYMEPEAFTLQPEPGELERFGSAVLVGYQEMDRIVSAATHLVGTEGTLVLCTAISQQPYTLRDAEGGNRVHRPFDIGGVVQAMGLPGVTAVAPVMSAEFHVYFASEADAEAAEQILRSARLAGRAALAVRRVGTDVFTGCSHTTDVPADAVLEVPRTGARLRFHDYFYRAETPKSGYHHRDGAFWVRTPDRIGGPSVGRAGLRSVAPTLLGLLGIDAPMSMRSPALDVSGLSPTRR